jgi:hypothetical protein
MYNQVLFGLVIMAAAMQMTECAAVKAQCSIWMELGRENDWTKDYFIPQRKERG